MNQYIITILVSFIFLVLLKTAIYLLSKQRYVSKEVGNELVKKNIQEESS